jgi:hypothetical protein
VFTPTPGGLVPEPEDLIEWMGVEGAFDLDELIRIGSLDARLTAIIWYALSRRASLLVAAGPRLAGKSTTTAALLALVNTGTPFLPVGGEFSSDSLDTVRDTGRSPYLVVNEVSSGIPGRYLWGDGVRALLAARSDGFPFVGTLHASSPEQVLETFSGPPLMLDERLVTASVDLILNLREGGQEDRGARELAVVEGTESPEIRTLMRWSPATRVFGYASDQEIGEVLSRLNGLAPGDALEELESRTAFLERLVARLEDPGRRTPRLREELGAFA